MPLFRISFAENDAPDEPVREFTVDCFLEGEAIERATELFRQQYPQADISNYEVRSRDA